MDAEFGVKVELDKESFAGLINQSIRVHPKLEPIQSQFKEFPAVLTPCIIL